MESRPKILQYREKLDKALASHDLVSEKSIKSLVKNQLARSSPSNPQGHTEKFVEKRTNEVSNFLDMLRSASGNDLVLPKTHGMSLREWKLKQDNEDYRVMYREGPEGTPFHTLLVEGYVEGPLDVCLCLCWESPLFKRWWPQFSVPPFKITSSTCLQRIQIGEQICLVRMKVAWPLSAREVILHYFEVEYFEDDLVFVIINTISDTEVVDEHTHGFTRDCIPDAKDIVRIDVVGGCVLQKVTSNISYFRTISTMDMKLDFVPPSLINFVSRQLIGSGFKLYQKTVASVAKGDEEFGKALKDPLYVRVREGLNHERKLERVPQLETVESEKSAGTWLDRETETPHVDAEVIDETLLCDSHATGISQAGTLGQISSSEIKEEEIEQETNLEGGGGTMNHSSPNVTADQCSNEKKVLISPQVEEALRTLDNVISMVRKGGCGIRNWSGFGSTNQELRTPERISTEVGSTSSGDVSDDEVCIKAPKIDSLDRTLDEAENASDVLHVRHRRPDSSMKQVNHNHNRIAPAASPVFSSRSEKMEAPVLDNMSRDHEEVTVKVNGIRENNGEEKLKQKKQRICCFHFCPSNI